MTSRWPAVTSIICTHHRPSTLSRALDSLLSQTWRDFETIVIHDGPPSDETVAVIQRYDALFEEAGLELRFTATDEESKYYCAPRNQAIAHSRGDYIYHLDDDNVAAPRCLEALHGALTEGVEWPDFSYGRINYCFEGGQRVEGPNGQELPEGLAPLQPWGETALLRLQSFSTNFIDTSSFMAAKGAYWRLYMATGMMFNEGQRRGGDWELLCRAVYFAGWRGKAVDEKVLDYFWNTPNQIQLNRPVEGVQGVAL